MEFIVVVSSLLWLIAGDVHCIRSDGFVTPIWYPQPDICESAPKGRVPWILHVRDSDYGWREHTHRANIAIAVNRYRVPEEDMRKMHLQLEVEVTRALFRNNTSPIHENDLALFIHALVATQKNPRDFHGTDLVADLLHRVNSARGNVHPFLVLALCNSHAVTLDHLIKIKGYLHHAGEDHPEIDSRQAQMKAIAYKAFACAASLDSNMDKFRREMENAAACLIRYHDRVNGTFGNVYTTSLVVQALTATSKVNSWDEQKAIDYLLRESEMDVNLIKAYYIEMALNARSVKFIKDLYSGTIVEPSEVPRVLKHCVQYTVKKGLHPEKFFSATLCIPPMNFFEIMQMTANLSDRFNFSYYENPENVPMVYAVNGTPNDAEENMFWRICRQNDVDHDRHVSTVTTFNDSPVRLMPKEGEHVILWYLDTDCPQK